jgi:TetR/AcrR family transcriptional regulator, regulator of cefoperazone and chloramphenicol sensitivity
MAHVFTETPPHAPTAGLHRAAPEHRADGAQARARLLAESLKLFAAQGYERTSTRDIARAAQVNISAISYYFGDKAGLYRAVFTETLGEPVHSVGFDDPSRSLEDALNLFFADFLAPLKKNNDVVRAVMKLHFREMVEPTGAWAAAIEHEIKPMHIALTRTITRALGLSRPDAECQRLALAIAGMAVHLFVGADVVEDVAPQLLATPRAVDQMAKRLAGYAQAMVEGEKARRKKEKL